jgi:hypothetical protein
MLLALLLVGQAGAQENDIPLPPPTVPSSEVPLPPPVPPAGEPQTAPVLPPASEPATPPGAGARTVQFQRDLLPPAPPAFVPAAPQERTLHFSRGTLRPEATAPRQLPGTPAGPVGKGERGFAEEYPEFSIQLEVPGIQRLFRLESEAALQERMRQEFKNKGERITFPDEPILSKEPYTPRQWVTRIRQVEPNYLMYGRLHFEQPNSERFGWEVPLFQPAIATAQFFFDVAMLPYHIGTRPLQCYDSNAGYCLPGDPVPLLLYPPEWSATGLTLEAGTLVGLFLIF